MSDETTTALDPATVLQALSLPSRGTVHDLGSGWWHGMPSVSCHPQFNVLTYRTPRGLHNQRDFWMISDDNDKRFSFVSELVMGTSHTGTHIDALCHVTCGEHDEWHGGVSANDALGDFGALSHDASELPPMVSRGVLLDVAGMLGGDRLPPRFSIDDELLVRTAEAKGVELREGDVVLVRTGQMRDWPDTEAMAASDGAGVTIEGARWLSARRPSAVGADTASFERVPSGIPGDPQPVHLHLMFEHGIPIMEWVDCESLARDGVSEFLFVALPLNITGATGSMIRPIGIA
jgi:kynurenine formamidase